MHIVRDDPMIISMAEYKKAHATKWQRFQDNKKFVFLCGALLTATVLPDKWRTGEDVRVDATAVSNTRLLPAEFTGQKDNAAFRQTSNLANEPAR
ncbi:MAG: hypothetical protein JWM96_877 [Alphaproteobacteria bacterium]|nr:hypothetical protein [Alphaproteobacteria bacterium]